ncbi:esterase [Gordonia amarae]|uniref:Mycolyltransferase n=2 Tax=Gordonia amarae TaxID=36821 RepID=G7GLL3_9ACTN|nr:alpha/beta hydrolase-fold protein [Gordonia amarae]MCS3876580.1 S-formylglutathione hydrolase FrmB [Gordonia amarae]QHN32858.1 esterase [Gordonia amarae]QHN41577.1 esterase [Gordonia amarae]GAB04488.1 mycolyltransferase [Gordonia amarae NBRC 15530]
MWQTTRSGESGGNRAARRSTARLGAARSGRSRVAAATAIGAGAIALSLVAGGAPAIADPAAPAPAPAPADPAKQTPTPAKPAPTPAKTTAKPAPATTQQPKPAPKPAPEANRKPAPETPKPAPPAAANDRAKVTNIYWYTSRRVALWVYSPAMKTNIQVQLLLARDWYSKPKAKFPQLTMLDGLRAQENQSGWIINTNIIDFYKDKNVNVVLPIGGESSFYTDWQQPDRGKHYMWETFLMKELPPILEKDWRSSTVRGIEGLSMGGSAAMMLAARNPGFYKFAASFSGILQLTSPGMAQAIQFAQRDGGGYDSEKMFGKPSDPAWAEHDPYVLADKLQGTSLYISSGNGVIGPHDQPSDIPLLATNYSGVGLEVLSRVTTQQFAIKLNEVGVPARSAYRPSGTHTWPYWQFEMQQAWPQAASALGLSGDKVSCGVYSKFKKVAEKNKKVLGECLTPDYAVPGGRAQDFAGGRIISGPKGPKVVTGAIGGAYTGAGGPGGKLGLPTSDELATRDGKGRFNTFQHGKITWDAKNGTKVLG